MFDEKAIRLKELAHRIFKTTPDGVEFLELFRYSLTAPTFPMHPEIIAQHGGAEGYGNFRAGQIHAVDLIPRLIQEHINSINPQRQEYAPNDPRDKQLVS